LFKAFDGFAHTNGSAHLTHARPLVAIRQLSGAGIPLNVAPVIPGLQDHKIPALPAAAAEAGVPGAGYELLRLPYGNLALIEN